MDKILDILNEGTRYLENKNIEQSRLKIEQILAETLNLDRVMLYANYEKTVSDEEKNIIREKMLRISNSENIFYEKDTLKFILDQSIDYLEKNDINESKINAEIIFSNVLNIDRMMLFTKYKEHLDANQVDKIRDLLTKRAKKKIPVQYLFNETEFYGRTFFVDKGVLIPRYDTEILVEKSIELLSNYEEPKILEIGVGSGAISITIAKEIEKSKVLAVDISDKAIEIANKNKQILDAKNLKIIKSDIFENVNYDKFNMIISNPPYIPNEEYEKLDLEVKDHEPITALLSEDNGYYFYNEISKQAMDYLDDNGVLIYECGHNQAKIIKSILENFGYKNIQSINDLNGIERVVFGYK